MDTKICSRCNEDKPLASFPVDRRHKLAVFGPVCFKCRHEQQRLYMRGYFKKCWKSEEFRAAHKAAALRSYHSRKGQGAPPRSRQAKTDRHPFHDFKCSRSEPFFVQGDLECLRFRFQNYLQFKFDDIVAHEYFLNPFDPRSQEALAKLQEIRNRAAAIIRSYEPEPAPAEPPQTPIPSQ